MRWWKLVHDGVGLTWWGRVRVWGWLRRVERIMDREIKRARVSEIDQLFYGDDK